jgi:hypothetical protein
MYAQKKIVPFAVFFAVAHPETFKLTRRLAGSWISSAEGLPTTAGLLLHALVFVLLVGFVMRMIYGGRKSGYEPASIEEEGDDMSWMSTSMGPAPAPAPAPEAVPRDYTNLFSSILGATGMNNFDQYM